MTEEVKLGGSANAPCPICGRPILFFRGEPGAFISEVKSFAADRLITLTCPTHGTFEVGAADFRDKEPVP